MSIVPVSDQQGTLTTRSSSDVWDPLRNFPEGFPFSLDLWDPFFDFPFQFPSFSRDVFPFPFSSVDTQIKWRETPRAHVFKAFLPRLTSDEVIVFIDDDKVLQISTDDGKFMSKFKLPDDTMVDQVKASMNNGMLTVIVSKMNETSSNVRVVEISGSDE